MNTLCQFLLASTITLSPLVLLPQNAAAAEISPIQMDFQVWQQTVLQKRFRLRGEDPNSPRLGGYLEFQPRFENNSSELGRILIRPAIFIEPDKAFSFWIGYAVVPEISGAAKGKVEHRTWQQAQHTGNLAEVTLINRVRLEERFLEDAEDVSVRLRYMIRASIPIDEEKKWLAIGSNETFFNLNSVERGPSSGFDQNRAFLGLGRRFELDAIKWRIELGYLNQFVARAKMNDKMGHATLIALIIDF